MVANEQEWKELLSKIGVLLYSTNYDATDKLFFLVTKTGMKTGLRLIYDIWEVKWRFFSIWQLEEKILQDGTQFVMFDNHEKLMYYNNPWQGCRSLEELKIKADLYCRDECIQ